MLVIVGFGNHVQKNVLPVLSKIKEIEVKYVVITNLEKYTKNNEYTFIDNIKIALEDEDITTVYIATPISLHYQFAKAALLAGKRVLCEKTLTDNLDDTQELVQIARSKGIKLQEVVMYHYHRQFKWIKNYFGDKANGRLVKVHAKFQIPHLKKDDIRYNKELGGGALLDVGFYPLSLVHAICGMPAGFTSSLFHQNGYDVDLLGAAIFNYNKFYSIAEWAIGSQYKNEVFLEFEDHNVFIERAFSKPSTLETKAVITKNGKICNEIIIDSDDQFYNLFTDFIKDDDFLGDLEGIIERAKLIEYIKDNS